MCSGPDGLAAACSGPARGAGGGGGSSVGPACWSQPSASHKGLIHSGPSDAATDCSAGHWAAEPHPCLGPGPQERAVGFGNTLGAFASRGLRVIFKLVHKSWEQVGGQTWARGGAGQLPGLLCTWLDGGRESRGSTQLSRQTGKAPSSLYKSLDSPVTPKSSSVCGAPVSVHVCAHVCVHAGPRETSPPAVLLPSPLGPLPPALRTSAF